MSGLNRNTGRAITGLAHVIQSLGEILFTPIGSRIARREFGSLLPELLDQPDNPQTRVRLYSAAAGAILRWEPRVRVSRILIQQGLQPGTSVLQLEGIYLPDGGRAQALSLRLPLQQRAALS